MVVHDSESGGGIVEWPELTHLLPRRSLYGLQADSLDSDATGMEAVTHKVRRVYRQSMAAENKRITLCVVLVLLAILLSGSVVMVVSFIKSRPDSEAYQVADEISSAIVPSWPDDVGTVVSVNNGGDSTENRDDLDMSTAAFDLSTSPSSSSSSTDSSTDPSFDIDEEEDTDINTDTNTYTNADTNADTGEDTTTTKPPPNPDAADFDPDNPPAAAGEGPAVGPAPAGPRPTLSPTAYVYDPLAPTRKPSPDPNDTKKPRSYARL